MTIELDYWYEIDPVEVAASVERKIAGNEKGRAAHKERVIKYASKNTPDPWPTHDAHYDDCNCLEREYYAKVRIVCLPLRRQKAKPYYLMYVDDDKNLTGGFRTIQEAARWFVNGGR
jgi:hypothetical protein